MNAPCQVKSHECASTAEIARASLADDLRISLELTQSELLEQSATHAALCRHAEEQGRILGDRAEEEWVAAERQKASCRDLCGEIRAVRGEMHAARAEAVAITDAFAKAEVANSC